MDEKIQKYLFDIKIALDEIDLFFENKPKRFDEYSSNIMLKRSIERNLEIIGEAMNRILSLDPQFPIENAKRIVSLRNQIIHGYDKVSDESIWGIVIVYLPKLRDELKKLIEEI